jgi:hypothetical protein
MSVCRVLHHIVTEITLYHSLATMTLNTIVAIDIIATFATQLVALLTALIVMWRKERLWGL